VQQPLLARDLVRVRVRVRVSYPCSRATLTLTLTQTLLARDRVGGERKGRHGDHGLLRVRVRVRVRG